ncbi:terminase large subunit domain-containing protein [Pseudomonas canadensis]|uniref:terminase large subunit domain-containing protein n=1 Tax=Pseudomonas canadensis TaxID=915099 RepID=UPI000403F38C|nr:terminase family protein [Pseudomonas canadensis]
MIANTGNLMLDRQLSRWYPLKDHPVQLALVAAVSEGIRFPLVPAGRRSGKTERFKRFLVKQASAYNGMYFAAAPTHAQAKKIFWDDLKAFTLSCMHSRRPSESDLIIYLDNGSEIHVIGLDKPQRIEGIPWTGGGIDEFADIKPDAWEANILPALNTVNPTMPDYRAWCWLLGVPDGLNHYYDLCMQAESGNDPNFRVFHWKSAEILPADVMDAMKRAMSAKQFKQEFEASFETASGRIYEDYSKANTTNAAIEPHEQLMWMHDQNFTPLSSAIGVRRNDGKDLYLLDEIVLISAVSKQSAAEFVDKFKDHKNKHVLIYGDPAGKAGEKHGHASDYTDIEGVLKANGWTYTRKVKPAHPSIKDRQNAVRAKILTSSGETSLFINPATAPWCHKGLSTVQLQMGSTFQEDQKNDYQHITTAIGYCIDVEWPCIKRTGGTRRIGGLA